MKICCICNIEKTDDCFYPSILKNRLSKCKDCFSDYYKKNKQKIQQYKNKYWQENKEALYKYKKQWRKKYLNVLKICPIHKVEYYSEECNICSGIRNKIYKNTHKKEIKEYQKSYASKNRDKININYKKRREKDPIYNLRRIISNSVYSMIKKQKCIKRGSISKYLPYSIQELREHLEKQFESWMNWYNHGKYIAEKWDDNDQSTWTWQIDHIIPQSKLPYTSMLDDNFKKCWSLDNLRPLNAKQNVIDGTTKSRHF